MRVKIVTASGLKFWTESFGRASDPACLLIAGAGAPSRFWTDHFATGLARRGYFVIRYDQRDVGLSSSVDYERNPYTVADLAMDALRVLDGYAIRRAHLIGHSFGGCVAQFIAAYHGEQALSLTSIASGPIGASTIEDGLPPAKDLQALKKRWGSLFERMVKRNTEKGMRFYVKIIRYLNGDLTLDKETAAAYTKDLFERCNHPLTTYKSALNIVEKTLQTFEDRRGALGQVRVPSLIIHGDKDIIVPLDKGGRATHEAISGSQFLIISGMGHMLFNGELERQLIVAVGDHLDIVPRGEREPRLWV